MNPPPVAFADPEGYYGEPRPGWVEAEGLPAFQLDAGEPIDSGNVNDRIALVDER